ILMGSPLPSINHAYSLLIQEEKQKEIHVAQHPVDSAFMAAKQQYGAQKFVNTEKKGNFEGKRNNIICNYCKKPGHTAERCYIIIGFPTDFKFTKNKRFQNGVQGNAVLTADDNANQSVANAERGITQEQYNNLCQLLQQVKHAPQGEISSEVNVTANCAGIPSHSFSNVPNSVVWIVDSGASEHMTCDFTLLFNIQTLIKPVLL
ncbi:hypothetical protein A4A49_57946, partial [Nicotiana attenuata]